MKTPDQREVVTGTETLSSAPSVRATSIGFVFLLLVTCIFFREPLFEGRVFRVADHAAFYVPMHVYNARLRAEGEIPLWNRHGFLGYPNQAETELGGVYPPGLIFNVVRDPGCAYSLFIVFHWLIALIGTMYLSRVVGAGVVGQTVAALVFVFGGTFVGQTYPATLMTTFAWTPLILGLQLRAFDRGSYGLATVAGIAFAVQTLGANAQQSFYVFLILILATLNEARGPNRATRLFQAGKLTLLMLVVGFGLSAPQVLYCLEHMLMTVQSLGYDYERQVQYSLPPQYFIQLLVPNLFGNDRFLLYSLSEARVYWGLLSLGLLALGWKASGRFSSLMRITLVVGLILVLGRFSGIYYLVGRLPGFQQVHYPCRALMVPSLAAAILVGQGMHRLVSSSWPPTFGRYYGRAYFVLAILLLTIGLTALASDKPGPVLRFYDRFVTAGGPAVDGRQTLKRADQMVGFAESAMMAAALAGSCGIFWVGVGRGHRRWLVAPCAIGLLAIDLLVSNGGVHAFGPPGFYSKVPSSVERLQSESGPFRVYGYRESIYEPELIGLPGDSAALFQIDALNTGAGAVPLGPKWFLGTAVNPVLNATSKELALFNVRFLLMNQPFSDRKQNPQEHVVRLFDTVTSNTGATWYIYELVQWQPRVSVREKYSIASSLATAKRTINSSEFSISKSVTLGEPPNFVDGEFVEQTPIDPQAQVFSYGAQRVTIDAVLPRRGILVLSDLNYPGWRATTNGQDVSILAANGLVRGLALGPGRHRIVFTYRPHSFFTGLVVTLATSIGLAVWGMIAGLRRRSFCGNRSAVVDVG